MKKIWTGIFTLLLAVFLIVPAHAELQDFWAQVYKDTGTKNADGSAQLTKVSSDVSFIVLAKGTDTLETTYYYGGSTSLTNPVSAANFASASICNGMVKFRTDPTDATDDRYVDLIVRDNSGGYTAIVKNFDKYNHAVVIDERLNEAHVGVYRMGVIGTSNSEMYTGIRFLADTIIDDVRIKVITAATGTMTVGLASATSGAPTGLLNGVSLVNTGFVPDTAFTSGSASSKYGTLLLQWPYSGAGNPLVPVRSGHAVSGSSASYLTVGVNTATGGHANIYYFFKRVN